MVPLWCDIYRFVLDWQTLLSAILALVAAWATIQAMRQQSDEEKRRHDEQIRRREMAARALMPEALSGMADYARETGQYLTGQITDLPATPADSIAALKSAIEHIDTQAALKTFELVSWYQVQRARNASEILSPSNPNIGERMYDIVLVHAYVNNLFDYARNESPTVEEKPPTRDQMFTAYRNTFSLIYTVRHPEKFVELGEIIQRRHTS
ncbi:hypothetical protein ACSBOB_18645 [Mesorhizobium sp. ASY16-5R]|uniref:hypothetical protein n=1 Tax=Mesorhizobium sp. ASY16-5R TaxID=3445772 RepID=UPI003FA0B42D